MERTEITIVSSSNAEPCCAGHITPRLAELEDEITTLCGHLGAAEYRLLVAIGEFDSRGGWAGIGIASCAHWLNWKCGLSLPAAHDRVRVARALRDLPVISAGMARGELSYSKVRALTRVATPANEESLARLAHQGTASHIEEIVRRYRKVCQADEAASAAKAQRGREVRYRWDDDGSLVLTARLPAEQGALLLQALKAATEAIRRADDSSAEESAARSRPTPDATDQSFAARRADALMLMAETALQHGPSELPAADRHQVIVHVDAAVLSGAADHGQCEIENGPALAIETARRLLCDSSVVTIHEDADGNPLNVGRKTRAISTALRRALQSRDRGCRFPGCSRKRFTDAHHIQHWANGGETKLDNLVLLCSVHHRLVHEEGFTVEETPKGLVFRVPNGRRLEEVPVQRVLLHDPVLALMSHHEELAITPRTCVPEWMGESPAYDWITDSLWRKDQSAGCDRHLNRPISSAVLG